MLEAYGLEPVYVDDRAFALSHGTNVNLMLFRYAAKIDNGITTYARTPALSLVVPWSAQLCKNPVPRLEAAATNRPGLSKLDCKYQWRKGTRRQYIRASRVPKPRLGDHSARGLHRKPPSLPPHEPSGRGFKQQMISDS